MCLLGNILRLKRSVINLITTTLLAVCSAFLLFGVHLARCCRSYESSKVFHVYHKAKGNYPCIICTACVSGEILNLHFFDTIDFVELWRYVKRLHLRGS